MQILVNKSQSLISLQTNRIETIGKLNRHKLAS